MGTITAGRLLGRVLRAAGIEAVYGEPAPGLDVVPVADPGVAGLLVHAHRQVQRRGAMAHYGGLLTRAGGSLLEVDHPADLGNAVAFLTSGGDGLRVLFDLAGPAPDFVPPTPAVDRWPDPDETVVAALRDAGNPVILAGPGVVDHDAVTGLHALAAAASVGVLNTWGAKGVFDWRSRHHLATAGLQARDFELGGVTAADLVLTTGLHPLEAPDPLWRRDGVPVVAVPPLGLAPLAERWSRPAQPIVMPPLRTGLAAVTQEGWAQTTMPLAPSLVTRHYAAVGPRGLVAADAGVAGFWVARTFATTELGGVAVPAERWPPGFAAACCLVARLRDADCPVLAAVDEPPDAVLDAAASLGVAVPVEVWEPDGEEIDPHRHVDRLRTIVHADTSTVVTLATDETQLARMVDVAGEVVAWGGLGT